jgi:energy-coupling factor transporter ATP-binding protein EcfA2
MNSNLLEVSSLVMKFQGITALDDVSFSLKQGEITSLIGPNGAGKTTMFNCITGMYTPTSGQVLFDGKDITAAPAHQISKHGIARTFQNLALFGGFISVKVLGIFEPMMESHRMLLFFTPLIAAMAGNVGVQSSAIVVQGLANNSITGSLWNRLLKELSLSLLNGSILAGILILGSHFLLGYEFIIGITVSIALLSVIVIASLIGTFIPIVLDKYGVDPALATGPFITTSNDIIGIIIYFTIAKLVLGI